MASEYPKLQSLLKLAIAYNNDFSIIDNSVTAEDIEEFIYWKISIKPTYSNSDAEACFKYHQELDKFKKFLEVTRKLNMEKLNYALNSCVTLKDLAISTIIENPEFFKPNILPADLEDKLTELGLTGEAAPKVL